MQMYQGLCKKNTFAVESHTHVKYKSRVEQAGLMHFKECKKHRRSDSNGTTYSKAHFLLSFHRELAQKSEEVALTIDCRGNTEYQCRCCFQPRI